jgi:hypothetical protein
MSVSHLNVSQCHMYRRFYVPYLLYKINMCIFNTYRNNLGLTCLSIQYSPNDVKSDLALQALVLGSNNSADR